VVVEANYKDREKGTGSQRFTRTPRDTAEDEDEDDDEDDQNNELTNW
jgi:hypothetical protein